MEKDFSEIRKDKIRYIIVNVPKKKNTEFRKHEPPKKYFFGLITNYQSGEPGGWYLDRYPTSEERLNELYIKKSDGWYSKYKVKVYFSNDINCYEYYETEKEVEEVLSELKDKTTNYIRF